MAAIKDGLQWLGKLKATQLHQLAVALGSACSGSKAIVADGIRQTLTSAPLDKFENSNRSASVVGDGKRQLSIVSIDMGIQNLAYAHLLASQPNHTSVKKFQNAGTTELPVLSAWERLAAFPADHQGDSTSKIVKPGSYTPSRYANAAHHFITEILVKYDPTHILIEQQRFRSGGSSAVAEWTIRVGVFEGMLHAILRTLREERRERLNLEAVVSINPARTARFWLEGSRRAERVIGARKITGREGKQAKIDIVGKSFLSSKDQLVKIGAREAKAMETAFLERWYSTSKAAKAVNLQKKVLSADRGRKRNGPPQPKLDDLADCLLQAVAWLEWQRMRELVLQDMIATDPVAAIRARLASMAFPSRMPKG